MSEELPQFPEIGKMTDKELDEYIKSMGFEPKEYRAHIAKEKEKFIKMFQKARERQKNESTNKSRS